MRPLYLILLIQVLIGCRTPTETSARKNRPSVNPLRKTRHYVTRPRDKEGYAPGARKNRLYEALTGHTGSHTQEPIKLIMQLISDPHPTQPPSNPHSPLEPRYPSPALQAGREKQGQAINSKRPRCEHFSEIPLPPEARRGPASELPLQPEACQGPVSELLLQPRAH